MIQLLLEKEPTLPLELYVFNRQEVIDHQNMCQYISTRTDGNKYNLNDKC
jgi:hypothetical protein